MKKLILISALLLIASNGWANCSKYWATDNWKSITACVDLSGVCTETDTQKSYKVNGYYTVGKSGSSKGKPFLGGGGFLPDLEADIQTQLASYADPTILITKLNPQLFNSNTWYLEAIFSYDSSEDVEGYRIHNAFRMKKGYCSLKVSDRKGSVPNLQDVDWCFSADALTTCLEDIYLK